MTSACWLVPDDRGGGVVSVAEGACRQVAARGIATSILMLRPPLGHAAEFASFPIHSLEAGPPYADSPARLIGWLEEHPQDVVLFNGCDQFDSALPFVPASTRIIYCVHDTAPRYFAAAVREQAGIDAIVAVSETVASQIRARLHDPAKLHVIHNGTVFPSTSSDPGEAERSDDLLFMGGDNPAKGAFDVLRLWPRLVAAGFGGTLQWFGPLEDAFRARIARLPAAERIVPHGRVLRSRIFEVAARCKAILMLSRGEPFGMATVEAMGMGCLPVAWAIDTGTTEIVPEHLRFFAPLGDFAGLADAVTRACRDHSRLSATGARLIRERFDEARMGGDYAELIERLLGAPPAVRSRAGQEPPVYAAPRRIYQLLPPGLRATLRRVTGRWPRLGHALRDARGL